MTSPTWLGPLSAFLASFTWVIGSSAYSHLSRRYVPGVVNFHRAACGFVAFAVYALLDSQDIANSLSALGPGALVERSVWLSISISASYVFGDALFLWAALSLGFPAAQALGAIYPLWAALAGVSFAGDSMSPLRFIGMALSVLGVVAIVRSGKQDILAKPPEDQKWLHARGVGVLLGFGTSIAWATNSYATSRGGQDMHLAAANLIRMSVALVLCPLAAMLQSRGKPLTLLMSRADYRRFLPIIAFESIAGAAVYLYGMSHSPVAVGATLSSLAPVLAVPLAVALGWERFSWRKTLAVTWVVLGVALLMAG